MAGNNQYRAADFIDAIPGTGGIISTIARKVGCSWHTAKKYIVEYATVAQAYADECEGITDLAESTVIRAIKDGDVSAAKWYLTMKGKERGYVDRQETSMDIKSDGKPIQVSEVVVNLAPDERESVED